MLGPFQDPAGLLRKHHSVFWEPDSEAPGSDGSSAGRSWCGRQAPQPWTEPGKATCAASWSRARTDPHPIRREPTEPDPPVLVSIRRLSRSGCSRWQLLRQRTVSSTAQQFADRRSSSRLTLKHGIGRPIAAVEKSTIAAGFPPCVARRRSHTSDYRFEERVRWRERREKVRGMGRRLTWNRGTRMVLLRKSHRAQSPHDQVRLKFICSKLAKHDCVDLAQIRIQDFHLDCPRWHLEAGHRFDIVARSRAPPPSGRRVSSICGGQTARSGSAPRLQP